jgi:hypothetical protein
VDPGDNPGIGARFAGAQFLHLAHRAQGVADEHRLGRHHLVEAEIGDQRAERRIAHRQADQQAEGEGRVDQNLPVTARLGRLDVQMQRLRIVGHDRKQQVVGLGHGAADLVLDPLTDDPLVEELARHYEAACP